MTSDDVNQGSPLDGSTPSSLSRLASALGCTVGDFYNTPPVNVAQLTELVRLWMSVKSNSDREQVLAYLREIISKNSR